jgi:uncharacterized membrane protein YqjE
MNTSLDNIGQLAATSRRLARTLLAIVKNRVELLMVAVQEGRELVLHAILLAVGLVVFGLLATMTLTAVVVVSWWDCSPVGVLAALTVLYGAAGFGLYRQLVRLIRKAQPLSALIDQIQKDRDSMEQTLP